MDLWIETAMEFEVDKKDSSGIIPRYRLDAEVHGSLVGPSDFKSDVGR